MAALPIKVHNFLQEVQDIENPTDAEKHRAMELLSETLRHRNMKLCRAKEDLASIARKLKALHVELEDMNRRLELTIKAGSGSQSIH
ncbi:MAG: hypothetical protein HY370_01975 [Proteobacteria bacterium]|nr:hypothetical protein [Pseudomonadota bacterium]